MINLESITQFILPLLLSYFAYLYGRKKDEAEIEKIKTENNLEEIDVVNRRIAMYKSEMSEMMNEIEDLKEQIKELKEMIESLVSNQCLGDNCSTKIEYNKILAKRAARKRVKNTEQ